MTTEAEQRFEYATGQWGDTQDIVAVDTPFQLINITSKIPRPWVITLAQPNLQPVPALAGGALAVDLTPGIDSGYTIARVSWGVRGGMAEAEIDWGRGCIFGLFGDQITLNAITPLLPPAAGHNLTLSAFAAPGHVGHQAFVTRTVSYGDIVGAANQVLPVPPFAKRMQLQRDWVSTGDNYTVQWMTGDVAALIRTGQYAGVASTSRLLLSEPWWIDVPPDANFMRILNDAAVNTMGQPKAIYQLAI